MSCYREQARHSKGNMDMGSYAAAVEKHLLNKKKKKLMCHKSALRGIKVGNVKLTEDQKRNLEEAFLKSPPPKFLIRESNIILRKCYHSATEKIKNVLKNDETGKLGHILNKIRKGLTKAEILAVNDKNSFMLDISGEEHTIISIRQKDDKDCEMHTKVYHYLLLEGLRDILLRLRKRGPILLEDLLILIAQRSAPRVLHILGKTMETFERTIKSYPKLFMVDGTQVELGEVPVLTYSAIVADFQSAVCTIESFMSRHRAIPDEDPWLIFQDILSPAEILAVGNYKQTVIKKYNKVENLTSRASVVVDSTLANALDKIKSIIDRDTHPDGCSVGKVKHLVLKLCTLQEIAAVGDNYTKVRKTLLAFPAHFEILEDERVCLVPDAPDTFAFGDPCTYSDADRFLEGHLGDDLSSASRSDWNSCSETDDDLDTTLVAQWEAIDRQKFSMCHPPCDDEVESLGSESVSDSRSVDLGSITDSDVEDVCIDDVGCNTITLLHNKDHFCQLVRHHLSQSSYPILAVSASSEWFFAALWDGIVFAIDLARLSGMRPPTTQLNQSEGSSSSASMDFLMDKSVLKIVFDLPAVLAEINKFCGISLVNVLDLKIVQSLVPKIAASSNSLASLLSQYRIESSANVAVCNGTILAPAPDDQIQSEEREGRLQSEGKFIMKAPRLYQKMIGSLTSRQIKDAFGRSEEVVRHCTGSVQSVIGSAQAATKESSSRVEQKNDRLDDTSDLQLKMSGRVNGHCIAQVKQTSPCVAPKSASYIPHAGNSSKGCEGNESTRSARPDVKARSHPKHPLVLHFTGKKEAMLIPYHSERAAVAINPCEVDHDLAAKFEKLVRGDMDVFLESFGICIKYALQKLAEQDSTLSLDLLCEVIMDVGRKPSARYYQPTEPHNFKTRILDDTAVTKDDLKEVLAGHCAPMTEDHRTSICGTLHRVGVITSRTNEPVGLTASCKHPVLGCATPLFDLMDRGQSILFLGCPGVGRTTILREAARVISDVLEKRVVIIDSLNEVAGSEDIPHPSVGGARRIQVSSSHSDQAQVIQEAVRLHSPQTLIIDEISSAADAAAVLDARQRGLQVLAGAQGQTIRDVLLAPSFAPLCGHVHGATLTTGRHVRYRGERREVNLERCRPAAFDILVEMRDRHSWVIHPSFSRSVDACLHREAACTQQRRVVMRQADKGEFPQVLVTETTEDYFLS